MDDRYLKPHIVIGDLSKIHELNNEEKILLGTDGSITNLLEILFGDEVVVETLYQEIIDNVNYRAVLLGVNGIPLIYATSETPLNRIDEIHMREKIKKDLLSADIPIGKILKIHNLETRREIVEISVKEVPDAVKNKLNPKRIKIPQRTYNIIHKNKVLMTITEMFNLEDHL
ncbi:chorismate pyruvate-lyase family protein [Methanococcus maripaludis]|uniref:Chorismate-pyruvate lyase n=1 Tax=Methanococcus maripaludis TaxID=39152 RepID=A0A7J9PC69_METMI|nr:chorismate pyruvate-lyase family protein [Methanococcus maripaludis]MBA2860741.1 chorismate-pyruvate lyase [Methanococcus maripaludis]